MTKLLKVTIVAAMLLTMIACVASAGQNAGALARIYWLTSNTVANPSRNIAGNPAAQKLLVTVKGCAMFRGADVQLLANAFDGSGLPLLWQDPIYTPKAGGWNTGSSAIFPNIATAVTSLTLSTSQTGDLYYNLDPCVTPHNVGTFWYSAAGAAGRARNIAIEYAVFGLVIDLSLVDPTVPVCINPNYRLPCGTGEKGNVMVLVDATTVKDFCSYENGYQYLTYGAPGSAPGCPGSTPTSSTTWGKIKHLYH
ncbi:MAG: hypothetical protein HZB25_03520 [Candidatus Eisenbacteria bacterium]|nr:hypothetical protein [Candidatus Eisenbacteria bacterium]